MKSVGCLQCLRLRHACFVTQPARIWLHEGLEPGEVSEKVQRRGCRRLDRRGGDGRRAAGAARAKDGSRGYEERAQHGGGRGRRHRCQSRNRSARAGARAGLGGARQKIKERSGSAQAQGYQEIRTCRSQDSSSSSAVPRLGSRSICLRRKGW